MRRIGKLRKDSYARRPKDENVGGSRTLRRLGSLAYKHDVHNLLNGDCDRETLQAQHEQIPLQVSGAPGMGW
jgi:hypothetical protein